MILFRELDQYFLEPMVARRAQVVARAAREQLGEIDPTTPGERPNRTKQASAPFLSREQSPNDDTAGKNRHAYLESVRVHMNCCLARHRRLVVLRSRLHRLSLSLHFN